MESREIDTIVFEFLDHSVECILVGNADQNNGGRNIIRALGERRRHLESGMTGLDDLLGEGDVRADENVEVRIDLTHG